MTNQLSEFAIRGCSHYDVSHRRGRGSGVFLLFFWRMGKGVWLYLAIFDEGVVHSWAVAVYSIERERRKPRAIEEQVLPRFVIKYNMIKNGATLSLIY